MNATSIVRGDFERLTRSARGLVLIFLAPLAVLLIAPAEQSDGAARILIAGSSARPSVAERLTQVMGESSQIAVVGRMQSAERDPLKRLRDSHLDILLNYEKYQHKDVRLTMYTAETDPVRLAELERLGAGILRAEAYISQRLRSTENGVSHSLFEANVWWARPALYEDLYMLGTLPVQPLTEYYPQAADPRVAMLPTLMLLLASLLPFALAMASADGDADDDATTWTQIATRTAARAVVPAAIALLATLAMLLLAEAALDVQIKAGVFRMLLVLLPLLLSGALAALLVARLSRSATELAAWCTLYLLFVVVLTSGAPLIERHTWVRAVAQTLPAMHFQPILSGWLFGAPYDARALWAAGRLLVIALAFWQGAIFVKWWDVSAARKIEPAADVLTTTPSAG